ncbi:MAG: cobalamin biosynthesis protein [Deltaproteobacteria bacterium]|jgi:cobalt-precorrin 5A hydrolase|nr:cobalamin biosynthesis protein [Deltaproteobacteria bacterium]
MTNSPKDFDFAVYALTLPGLRVAEKIARGLPARLCLSERLKGETELEARAFSGISAFLGENFRAYKGHVAVAATGLVVRAVAPFLGSKKDDPAVVSLGQDGKHVISLLSGHLGGGNELAKRVALITSGVPVINTATDIAEKPAVETVARDLGLAIENFAALAPVSRELVEGSKIPVWDPGDWLMPSLAPWKDSFARLEDPGDFPGSGGKPPSPFIYADYVVRELPPGALVMRPRVLVAGMGCHRGIEFSELKSFVDEVFGEASLSPLSLAVIATAEIRGSESAIVKLSEAMDCPLAIQSMTALAEVETPNPSDTVFERIGVFSVCEAAARLASRMGRLTVPKKKSKKATLAIAIMNCS